MTEYIEREAAINQVLSNDIDNSYPRMDIVSRLHDLPAADVRPVVRGKWKRDGQCNILRCSECNTPSMNAQNFCSVCGADMMGGNK